MALPLGQTVPRLGEPGCMPFSLVALFGRVADPACKDSLAKGSPQQNPQSTRKHAGGSVTRGIVFRPLLPDRFTDLQSSEGLDACVNIGQPRRTGCVTEGQEKGVNHLEHSWGAFNGTTPEFLLVDVLSADLAGISNYFPCRRFQSQCRINRPCHDKQNWQQELYSTFQF